VLTDFLFSWSPWLLPITLFVLLAASIELPYRLVRGRIPTAMVSEDWNALQTGLLTLAAFVLSLSFAQAAGRYDERRVLVVKEANAIGTTWLRADQLPAAQAAKFRKVLTDYTAARLEAYTTPRAPELYRKTIEESDRDQTALWAIASSELRAHEGNLGLSLLMQTLNDTIDVSAEQLQALTSRVPTAMVFLTMLLVFLGAFSMGLRFARDGARPILMSALFVMSSVVVVSMSVDYDRPQTGFVKVNLNPLVNQIQSMQASR
jgi:hypothetical protein